MSERSYRVKPLLIAMTMLPVSLAVLMVIVYLAGDYDNLPQVAVRTRWWYFAVVPLTIPIFYWLHALRISIALRSVGRIPPPPQSLATCIWSGTLANVAIPGMGGELISAYLASRFYGVPMPSTLAASAYTKVLGLTANLTIAFLGVALMPAGQDAGAGFFTVRVLVTTALGLLAVAALFSVLFPGLLRFMAGLARRWLKLGPPEREERPLRRLICRAADGLDRTAEDFRAMRKGGLRSAAKIFGITLFINMAFSAALVLGFLAVGFIPALYQVFLFYSVLVVVFLVAMVFLGGLVAVELVALAYWSRLTGLSASEILVAALAVKLWQACEVSAAGFFFFRFASRMPREEWAGWFRRKVPPRQDPTS